MTEPRARKIVLECEHVLWMKPPLPNAGEHLYCRPCQQYQPVGPLETKGRIYEPDSNYSWTREGRLYRARCEAKPCDYTSHSPNWYHLRDRMDSHYLRTHSGSTVIFGTPTPVPQRLPRNSPPPF